MTDFRIRLTPEQLADGSPEERASFGHLVIHAGQTLLSEGFDHLVDIRRDGPLASGYPLAEWFLWNWWRLRYEPRPTGPVPIDWRQSHCMAEIGEGYVWPNITIVSDGQRTVIQSAASERGNVSSFRYYGASHPVLLPWSQVEAGIDDFVATVMAFTNEDGVHDTNLDRLWRDLTAERGDPKIARFRRFEALLGADPDELPEEDIIGRLADAAALGDSAVDELAAAAAGVGIEAMLTLEEIRQIAQTNGQEMRAEDALQFEHRSAAPQRPTVRGENEPLAEVMPIANPPTALQPARPPAYLTPSEAQSAAELGILAAHEARKRASLRYGAIDNSRLAEIAGVSRSVLASVAEKQPISFALRDDGANSRIVLRGKRSENRRFDLARLIGDHLIWGSQPMRPSTDTRTYRQKAQRAFAAEFLAPIEAVKARAEGDYSDDAKEEVARHFKVSSMVIDRLLKNNHVIPRDADDYADVV
ncbi:MAG: ImmA/IrrE family metallo-endopeptidase [Roseovarius sp.]|uniref:ImmA/IrrE family metallo-endopeptidase n=1 Tax=Roseovarius sp. TaxID=1486281 RepID=UPI00405A0241